MEKQVFTVSIYSEHMVGVLNRITSIFLKRHINIESLTASQSELKGIHRFTLVVVVTEEQIQKVITQLEKQVEVIKAYYHTDEEIVYQEVALYKISTKNLYDGVLQKLVKEAKGHIVEVEKDYFVVEKSGVYAETQALYDQLHDHGLMQFVRSGRVSVSKAKMPVSDIIKGEINNVQS